MADPGRCAVLFVDDEPMVLQGLRRMLHAEGRRWTLRFAASGPEALDLMGRERFDAVVSDLRMPGMDGVALLSIVMERYPHVARIVLSGEMDPERTLEAVRCAHQFLSKPCEPAALKATLARAFALSRLLEESPIKRLLPRLQTLPSLPALYTEVMAEIQAPNSSFRRVGNVVARDISMSAKILQMVNSAFFGLSRRIVSPQEAVGLLGFDTVKTLVLSAKIFTQFDPHCIPSISLTELWDHSLETGLIARMLAKAENLPRPDMEAAFTAGILHDLGKLILAQNFSDEYTAAVNQARREAAGLWEIEPVVFGASHAEVGAYLMGLWGIAEEVVNAIAFHHRPAAAPAPDRILALLHAADALEHRLSGHPGGQTGPQIDQTFLGAFHLADRLGVWEQACRDVRSQEAARVR
jgi:putative nucleotidyltransferase with HDIG domain